MHPHVARFGKRIIYWKLAINRSYGHISLPMQVAQFLILIYLFFKSYLITGVVFTVIVALTLVIGHLDLKYGVFELEQSTNNQYNPELQTLLGNAPKAPRKKKRGRYGK